jgi:hypothetical protein
MALLFLMMVTFGLAAAIAFTAWLLSRLDRQGRRTRSNA